MKEKGGFKNTVNLLSVNLVFWVLLSFFDIVRMYLYYANSAQEDPFPLNYALSYTIPNYLAWAVVSIPIWWLTKILYAQKLRVAIPAHIVLSFIITAIQMFLMLVFYKSAHDLFMEEPFESTIIDAYRANLPRIGYSITFYIIIVLIIVSFKTYKSFQSQKVKAVELESELKGAQLDNLKMQLKPHFLFNALNTVNMQIRKKENEDAINMITALSDLLRSTLTRENAQKVTLDYELEMIKKYLKIEEARFDDSLKVEINVQQDANSCLVPNLILQPIVENAFKHGVSENLDNTTIRIKAEIAHKKLHLSVYNSGSKLADNWDINKHKRVGLTNTIERLARLYGKDAELKVSNAEDGVLVNINIPCENA